MISNLKFSYNDCTTNDKIGILNQNPLIITKSEAFSFSYADPDRLKYAQLLAKRDIKVLKSTESAKESSVKIVEPQGRCKKAVTVINPALKKKSEERVSSIKRVPGPATPSRVAQGRKNLSSILRMPSRSMSPPVKDTDTNWRPRENVPVVDRLQQQVEQCTEKLDRLERSLRAQGASGVPHTVTTRLRGLPGKSQRDLNLLEHKLRSLVQCEPPVRVVAHEPRAPSLGRLPIDDILTRLDTLASEMDTIRGRWISLPYESMCHSVDDGDIHDGSASHVTHKDTPMRFTRHATEPWIEAALTPHDHRVSLDVNSQTVTRLDKDRHRFHDAQRFQCLAHTQISASRAGEWFAEDIVCEVVDDVIREFDETSGQLVEAILNEELTN